MNRNNYTDYYQAPSIVAMFDQNNQIKLLSMVDDESKKFILERI